MISGLLKLMCRLGSTGYQTDSEIPFRIYFITGDSLASRKVQCAQFHPGIFFTSFNELEGHKRYTY